MAPAFAEAVDLEDDAHILDLGGGTGIYAYALLQSIRRQPQRFWIGLVLRVAKELAIQYGVTERVEYQPGDMFSDELQTEYDAIVLSNILHDWDVPNVTTGFQISGPPQRERKTSDSRCLPE